MYSSYRYNGMWNLHIPTAHYSNRFMVNLMMEIKVENEWCWDVMRICVSQWGWCKKSVIPLDMWYCDILRMGFVSNDITIVSLPILEVNCCIDWCHPLSLYCALSCMVHLRKDVNPCNCVDMSGYHMSIKYLYSLRLLQAGVTAVALIRLWLLIKWRLVSLWLLRDGSSYFNHNWTRFVLMVSVG